MSADLVLQTKSVDREPSAPIAEAELKQTLKTELSFKSKCAVLLAIIDAIVTIGAALFMLLVLWCDGNEKGGRAERQWPIVLVFLELASFAILSVWRLMQIRLAVCQLSAAPLRWPLLALRLLVVCHILFLFSILCHQAFQRNICTTENIFPFLLYFFLVALYFHVEYLAVKSLRNKLKGP